MRRLFLTFTVSIVILVAGALVPERGGVHFPAAPITAPANAGLV